MRVFTMEMAGGNRNERSERWQREAHDKLHERVSDDKWERVRTETEEKTKNMTSRNKGK